MKKQNGEKALAAAAGISVPLLRYYRARGIGNDAEESAAAVELRQAEILRGAGFPQRRPRGFCIARIALQRKRRRFCRGCGAQACFLAF